MRTVLSVVGFALLFWVASDLIGLAIPDVGSTANTAIGGVALVAGGIYGWRRAQRTGRAIAKPTLPQIRTSRVRRLAGVSLFLVVTVGWVYGLASVEWIYEDFYVACGLSAVILVITGYLLGRYKDALWLVWIPGVAMTVVGFWMNPTPGGDDSGAALIFFGPIVATFGAALYFFPLIALGVLLRRLGERRSPRLPPPSASASRSPTPRTSYPGTR